MCDCETWEQEGYAGRERYWRRRLESQDYDWQLRMKEMERCRKEAFEYDERRREEKDRELEVTRRMLEVARNNKPDGGKKRDASADDKNSGSLQDDEDTKHRAKKLKTHLNQGNETESEGIVSTGDSATTFVLDSADATTSGDLGAIRENLLGLSYAMFDALFRTKSFHPKAFCEYLLKTGETALAEAMALAGVEISQGDADHVRYILQDLVPRSDDVDHLIERLAGLVNIKGEYYTRERRDEGRRLLLGWLGPNGSQETAFATALLLDDESERFQAAFPFVDENPGRMQQLVAACSHLYSSKNMDVFSSDADRNKFLATYPRDTETPSRPHLKDYIDYAAKKMTTEEGKALAVTMLERKMNENLTGNCLFDWVLPPGSAVDKETAQQLAAKYRTIAFQLMSDRLSRINHKVFRDEGISENLHRLNIDAKAILLPLIQPHTELPERDCKSVHRFGSAAFKCTKCRTRQHAVSLVLGTILAIRRNDSTMADPRFQSLCLEPGQVRVTLKTCGVHSEAIDGFLQDCSPDDFARPDVVVDVPEPVQSHAIVPDSTIRASSRPEPVHSNAVFPDATNSASPTPESAQCSAIVPDSTTSASPRPETAPSSVVLTTSASPRPETVQSSEIVPDATTSSSSSLETVQYSESVPDATTSAAPSSTSMPDTPVSSSATVIRD